MNRKAMTFSDNTAAPADRANAQLQAPPRSHRKRNPVPVPETRLLVVEHLSSPGRITRQLIEEGYTQVQCLRLKELLNMDLSQVRPQVLMIECQQVDTPLLALLKRLNSGPPCPSLVISQSAATGDEISRVIEAGGCNFIGPENTLTCLQTLIETTCIQFQRLQALQKELQTLQTRLDDRKQIERAKGLLMKKHQCDEEQAYIALRKLSMNRAQNMGEVARELLQMLES